MNPSLPTDTDPAVCFQRGVSGVKYLERFGGYARQRELGMLQFQVMSIFDHLLVDNLGAARDGVALLAVTIEQMAMDNGRMDVAAVLSLQEDVPGMCPAQSSPTVKLSALQDRELLHRWQNNDGSQRHLPTCERWMSSLQSARSSCQANDLQELHPIQPQPQRKLQSQTIELEDEAGMQL